MTYPSFPSPGNRVLHIDVSIPAHDARLILDALEALRMRATTTSYRSIDALADAIKEQLR